MVYNDSQKVINKLYRHELKKEIEKKQSAALVTFDIIRQAKKSGLSVSSILRGKK